MTFIDFVPPKDPIYELDVDIFSHCALNGVINDNTIVRLHCNIITGSANNVRGNEEKHSYFLLDKRILYGPDYVINAGGMINVAGELEGYDEQWATQKTACSYDVILDILTYSEPNNQPTPIASNMLAEKRINNMDHIHKIYSSLSHLASHIGKMYGEKR